MILDTSIYVYSWNGYVYGDNVAELREELPTKLNVTNKAGLNGKRIGESFQDIKRLIVSGQLNEQDTGESSEIPLRVVVQRFRFAHRGEIGKARLYLHNAADSRPAEFVLAAVEAVNGLKWEQPITVTEFEVSFVAEPEVWYDSLQTVDIRTGGVTVGPSTSYLKVVTYKGPDSDFFADAEGLPIFFLTVSSLNGAQLGTGDPPYVEIGNSFGTQTFRLYPQANGPFVLDSYEEGIRSGSTWAGGTIFEFADYEQFIYLGGVATGAGQTQTITLLCHHCDVSAASMQYLPRHW